MLDSVSIRPVEATSKYVRHSILTEIVRVKKRRIQDVLSEVKRD